MKTLPKVLYKQAKVTLDSFSQQSHDEHISQIPPPPTCFFCLGGGGVEVLGPSPCMFYFCLGPLPIHFWFHPHDLEWISLNSYYNNCPNLKTND